MKQRGRKSAAELEIFSNVARPVERGERLKAPPELTDEETEIWAGVVNAEAADWFSASTIPLLVQYCRHTVAARRVAELIERATGDKNLKARDYDRLLKMQDRESRQISWLASKMRIAQQSTTNQRGNKKSGTSGKPWEG